MEKAVNELIQKIKELGEEGTGALGYTSYMELLCLANEIKGEMNTRVEMV